MTLRSVFDGEGFGSSPGQFLQMMERWIYQNGSSDLIQYFEENEGYSVSDHAEMLVEWMDANATEGQIDSCVHFIMDELEQPDNDNQDICRDDDHYDSFD